MLKEDPDNLTEMPAFGASFQVIDHSILHNEFKNILG